MKQLTRNIAYLIVTLILFTACSTAPQVDNPQRIGTWDILSAERAKWNPVGSTSAYRVAFADSTSPDTTYFYDNGQIQATITPPVVRGGMTVGDFEFSITDSELSNTILLDSLDFAGIEIQNIGSAFTIEGFRGSTFAPDMVTFKIQTSYDCNDTNDNSKNLRIAFLTVSDSTGRQDTSMVYELATKGLYSTANYIVCQN